MHTTPFLLSQLRLPCSSLSTSCASSSLNLNSHPSRAARCKVENIERRSNLSVQVTSILRGEIKPSSPQTPDNLYSKHVFLGLIVRSQEFIEEYEKPNRPVILTDVVKSWPAFQRWDWDVLEQVATPTCPNPARSNLSAGSYHISAVSYSTIC